MFWFWAGVAGAGQTILDEGLRNEIPAGWTVHEAFTESGVGGYIRVTGMVGWVQSPRMNLEDWTNVQLSFAVAKYGAGDNGPITVRVSVDGGATWDAQVFDSPTPTSASPYSNSGPTEITALSSNTVIRWTAENSPSQKRLRDVTLTGTGKGDPVIIDPDPEPEPPPIRFQGFEGTDEDAWTYQIFAGTGHAGITDEPLGQTGAFSLWLAGSADGTANPYVLFDNVDLAGLSNVVFSIGYAAYGMDNDDDLYVDFSYDNGETWPDTVELMNGFSNFDLDFGQTDEARTVDANPYERAIGEEHGQVRVRVRFDEAAGQDNRFDFYFIDDVALWAEGEQPVLAFAGTDSRATEGDADVRIAVTISEAANATVNVRVEGTATVNEDYTLASTSLVFAVDGPTAQELKLSIFDDGIPEGPEYVRFTLEGAEGAGIAGPAQHTLLIRDNQSVSIMAANLPSGQPGHTYGAAGKRMIRALNPDVVAIQEWRLDDGATFEQFVEEQFGESFEWFLGAGTLPTGVISRWPILASGNWADDTISNRDFSWASIDLPGPNNLHVVSVHFKTGGAGSDRDQRIQQARLLTNYIAQAGFPENDYLVIAGDVNVQNRTEATMTILENVVTDAIQPVDQNGVRETNNPRNQHYDFVLPDPDLNEFHMPLEFGGFTFSNGIVFDTRLWSEHPLPARIGDAGDSDLQHLAVMKVFALESGDPFVDTDGDGIPDWWEEKYFGGPTNAVATDWAANQVNTVYEAFIADLDPTDPSAEFIVASVAALDGGGCDFIIAYTSPERVYDAHWRTNLLDGEEWNAIQLDIPGTGSNLILRLTNDFSGPVYFFRAAVRLGDHP